MLSTVIQISPTCGHRKVPPPFGELIIDTDAGGRLWAGRLRLVQVAVGARVRDRLIGMVGGGLRTRWAFQVVGSDQNGVVRGRLRWFRRFPCMAPVEPR